MTTLAPLPTWRALLSFCFNYNSNDSALASPWLRSDDETAGWFSRTCWSLALIAHWRSSNYPTQPVTIWLPDYFCNSSLTLLRQANFRLHFYKITNSLSPDFSDINHQSTFVPCSIFVLVHFFGSPVKTIQARNFCKTSGAWLVEDAAHVFLPSPGVGQVGDFVLYSPHKLLALPDGALLIARPNGPCSLGTDFIINLGPSYTWADQAALLVPFSGRLHLLRWIFKRSIQKLGLGHFRRASQAVIDPGSSHIPPSKMSVFSRSALQSYIPHLHSISNLRRRMQILLDHLLLHHSYPLSVDQMPRPDHPQSVLYLAGYHHSPSKSSHIRPNFHRLPRLNWPDLPPEVLSAPHHHSSAISLCETTFFVPVHQSLKERHLLRCFSPYPHVDHSIQVSLWMGDQHEWSQLLISAGFSNILQSWCYGEAKSRTSGWNIKRYVLLRQGCIVGFFQILVRIIAGVIVLSRLNRGPIFFDNLEAPIRLAALRAVSAEFGCWWKGRFLSWAPELYLEGEDLVQLFSTNFRQISSRSWNSFFVDLDQDVSRLRSRLDGKWRNILNSSSRHGLLVEQLNDDDDAFEKLLDCCSLTMQSKAIDFNACLYRSLRHQLSSESSPGLLLAIRRDDELLAATYVPIHGNMATYLLGYNSTSGRKLGAHHLLLWENIIRLKQMNVRYFDLGGFDETNAPGIARFKRGLGGAAYSLVGEGFCF